MSWLLLAPLSCLYLIDLGKGLATCLRPRKTRCTLLHQPFCSPLSSLPSWSSMILRA